MPKNAEGLEQLLVEELQDLFDAEKQLVRALPKMAKSAADEELENALREHLEVTRGQVERLEQVFASLNTRARSRPCKGMRGIVEEGQEKMEEEKDQPVLDSALISAARKVEHYEMVGYESARSLARQVGNRKAADMLEQTLREEIQADKELAAISKRLLKQVPAGAGERARGTGMEAGRQKQKRTAAASGRASAKGSASRAGKSAYPLTDHDEIRQWAEQRGAQPACVKGTGGRGDTGMIRLDFPGYTGEDSLQEISWDDWFEKFDESGLALMVQDTTAGGQKSNFNKLVKRQTARGGRARAAR